MRRIIKKFIKRPEVNVEQEDSDLEDLDYLDFEESEAASQPYLSKLAHDHVEEPAVITEEFDETNYDEEEEYPQISSDYQLAPMATLNTATTEVPAEYAESFSDCLQTIINNDVEKFRNIISTNPQLLNFHLTEDEEESSLLYKTIIFNRIEIADTILGITGANHIIKSGTTALHIASSINNQELCTIILKHGAQVNARNHNGFTAFESAVICKCFDAAKLLLNHGANINGRNKYGFTTLDNAASHGDLDEIEFLITNHADVNTADQFGNTPLHNAVKNNSIEACRLLLKHGAIANLPDKFNNTPEHYAKQQGLDEIVQLLNHVAQ